MGVSTYLYEAKHPVMEDSGGIIFGQNGTDQNSFNKLLRCHQNMEAMAAVFHTSLKYLWDNDDIKNVKKQVPL